MPPKRKPKAKAAAKVTFAPSPRKRDRAAPTAAEISPAPHVVISRVSLRPSPKPTPKLKVYELDEPPKKKRAARKKAAAAKPKEKKARKPAAPRQKKAPQEPPAASVSPHLATWHFERICTEADLELLALAVLTASRLAHQEDRARSHGTWDHNIESNTARIGEQFPDVPLSERKHLAVTATAIDVLSGD